MEDMAITPRSPSERTPLFYLRTMLNPSLRLSLRVAGQGTGQVDIRLAI